MPFTHVEIEQRKSRNIMLLFLFLVGLYGVSTATLIWGLKAFGGWGERLVFRDLATGVVVSLAVSVLHWTASTHNLCTRILDALRAQPVDSRDAYHARFANIVQEVSVATGGRPIQPYVIPTSAVNACAATDFAGRSAIAVTEGGLALLNREQLESVIGHEAAHIVSGDALGTTVFCGLFALHEEVLRVLTVIFRSDLEGVRVGGTAGLLLRARTALGLVFALVVLWITVALKALCQILISREKEYRADAVAVRLTRNPLSLAEALRLMSEKRTGISAEGDALSSIFIVDPGGEYFSEREGLMADLFSTHPPTEKRIEVLLGMAHLDPARFDEELEASVERKRLRRMPAPITIDEAPAQWMVWKDGQWVGPFGIESVAEAANLLPDSWVQRLGEQSVKPAHQDPKLLEVIRKRYVGSAQTLSRWECPNCRVQLISVVYEGAPIEECPACHGCYVDPSTMMKIFAREEYGFPEPVKRLGDLLLATEGRSRRYRSLPTASWQAGDARCPRCGSGVMVRRETSLQPFDVWQCDACGFGSLKSPVRLPKGRPGHPIDRLCPRCGAAVVRKFYTEAYPVEVEQCWICGLAWLDHQELELLQYLYEKRQAAHAPPGH